MARKRGNSTAKYLQFPEPPKLAGSKQIAGGNTDRFSLRLSRFTNLCSLLDGGIAANCLNRSDRDTETMA
jgi:hypothetical protein